MHRLPLLTAAPALLLAACGSQTDRTPAAPETPEVVTADTEGTERPATTPDGPLTAIPARFHGVWDAEGGSCMAASDLRLEVEAREIGFYESRGTVTGVSETADGAAAITLAMEGEGERWDMAVTLAHTGSGAGERLAVTWPAHDRVPAPQPILLRRCPS